MAHNPPRSSRPTVNRGYSAPVLSRGPTSSSSTTTTSSSTTSTSTTRTRTDDPGYGYFSPQAPSSTLASPLPPAPPPTAASPYAPAHFPIITATVTSRNPGGSTTTTSSVATPDQDPFRQFAMHIPHPPTLSLAASAARGHHSHSSSHSSTTSTSSSSSHLGYSGLGGPQVQPVPYNSTSRATHTPGGYDDLPSPMDRSRRMPPSSHSPQMHIASSVYSYTLSVQLPSAIQPEMVTVCANKGDKIKVVADVWHMENESHYEWQICFPPHDIDMGAVHARFDDTRNLTIDVRRIPRMYRA